MKMVTHKQLLAWVNSYIGLGKGIIVYHELTGGLKLVLVEPPRDSSYKVLVSFSQLNKEIKQEFKPFSGPVMTIDKIEGKTKKPLTKVRIKELEELYYKKIKQLVESKVKKEQGYTHEVLTQAILLIAKKHEDEIVKQFMDKFSDYYIPQGGNYPTKYKDIYQRAFKFRGNSQTIKVTFRANKELSKLLTVRIGDIKQLTYRDLGIPLFQDGEMSKFLVDELSKYTKRGLGLTLHAQLTPINN